MMGGYARFPGKIRAEQPLYWTTDFWWIRDFIRMGMFSIEGTYGVDSQGKMSGPTRSIHLLIPHPYSTREMLQELLIQIRKS